MEAERFDAIVRDLATRSRRRLLGLLPVALIGAAMSGGASTEAKRKRRRKKRKKRHRRCPSSAPKECGGNCCAKDAPVCCKNPYRRGGTECLGKHYRCCPVEFGGGACTFNEVCCPPRKGGIFPLCTNPVLGEHCCPLDSGGYCRPSESCCAPGMTNGDNYGCCETGRACCNGDGDCGVGLTCYFGCCYPI
jgi:hypothetical protein